MFKSSGPRVLMIWKLREIGCSGSVPPFCASLNVLKIAPSLTHRLRGSQLPVVSFLDRHSADPISQQEWNRPSKQT